MRLVNYPRISVVIGLCGLAYLVGLAVNIGNLSFISFARGQPALTTSQSDALNAYNKTVQDFRSILKERRTQINANQKLPDKPGQELYLARVAMCPVLGLRRDLRTDQFDAEDRPHGYQAS